jgi:hypothetical protein
MILTTYENFVILGMVRIMVYHWVDCIIFNPKNHW